MSRVLLKASVQMKPVPFGAQLEIYLRESVRIGHLLRNLKEPAHRITDNLLRMSAQKKSHGR